MAFARVVGGNRRRYGGYTAHIGLITVAVAIAASSTFRYEREATVRRGEGVSLRGFTVVLDRLWGRDEPRRFVIGADLSVQESGRTVGHMTPRLNFYRQSEQPVATPAVRSRPAGDLYVNLMAFERDGSQATLRVLVEPLVGWIWVGGAVVALGALIAIWPGARAPLRAPRPVVPAAEPLREPLDEDADEGIPAEPAAEGAR